MNRKERRRLARAKAKEEKTLKKEFKKHIESHLDFLDFINEIRRRAKEQGREWLYEYLDALEYDDLPNFFSQETREELARDLHLKYREKVAELTDEQFKDEIFGERRLKLLHLPVHKKLNPNEKVKALNLTEFISRFYYSQRM